MHLTACCMMSATSRVALFTDFRFTFCTLYTVHCLFNNKKSSQQRVVHRMSVPCAGSAPLVAPGRREDVLDRFSCHTAICPDSLGFYNSVTTLSKVAQTSTAAAAVIGLWYSLQTSTGQVTLEAKPIAAIVASFAASAALRGILQWLIGQFSYVYKPSDQQKDLAKLTNITKNMQQEPTAGYRP